MLPNDFADADGSVLHKRFACRPKVIADLKKVLKCPWREAVILKGEPTIGKVELVRSGAPTRTQPATPLHARRRRPALRSDLWCRRVAALLRRDFIYVPCTTESTVLSVLQEIVGHLEVGHCDAPYD